MSELAQYIDKPANNEEILAAMQEHIVRDIKGEVDDEEITFFFNDCMVLFDHYQDCCENVFIEDINGDWSDLIGTMLVVASERTSEEPESDAEIIEEDLWTFYTFRSLKGSVDVRWHGTCNGYYSMAVSINVKPLPTE